MGEEIKREGEADDKGEGKGERKMRKGEREKEERKGEMRNGKGERSTARVTCFFRRSSFR